MTTQQPLLLALDTATETCSVALVRGGVVDELTEHVGQTHSARILPMIDQVFARGHYKLADCTAIAFGAGPGSFTGLRIACGIVQGLAWGADKQVLPVGNLAALALRGADHLDLDSPSAPSRLIAVAIDARLGECYWALYETAAGGLRERRAPALATVDELPVLLGAAPIDLLVGNAITAFPQLRARLSTRVRTLPLGSAGAGAIARLAQVDWNAGLAVPAAAAAPLYVRERVALTIDERRVLADAVRAGSSGKAEPTDPADTSAPRAEACAAIVPGAS